MKTKLNLLAAGIILAAQTTGFAQPVITQQPQSCTNVVGTTATFSVAATGTEPLAYQWQKLVGYWADLVNRTDTLGLTNVQSTRAGDYRVIVTNMDGAATSTVAHLTVVVPPRITYTTNLQHQAVDISAKASFTVTASGTAPFSYQWRLNGQELPGQTSNTIIFSAAQPADEGDYTVQVTNLAGAATSEPTRLWVVPVATSFIKGNFTNALGRLPYFYLLPTNYNAARTYPLWINFHGMGFDETAITTPNYGWPGVAEFPSLKTFASYRQQQRDPVILFWPTRRAGDGEWTGSYLNQASAMLDQFISQFRVDTNRIWVTGASEGVHAAWDMIAMRPGLFAGAGLAAGWPGRALVASVKDVPVWAWCSSDDDAGQVGNTQAFVRSLRQAGANPIYTEYNSGGHLGGILMGPTTPTLVEWFLAQRRGLAPTNEPLVSITSPTVQAVLATGATELNLAGTAAALGRDVMQVTWTDFANNVKGLASGTNLWSVTNIPLVANKTNVIAVVATTTSWAPAYGGNTTFNDTLTVIQSPIRATLALQGAELILNWTGGGPPYRVQQATDLAAGNWTDYLANATPPVSLPLTGQAGFYRIVGE